MSELWPTSEVKRRVLLKALVRLGLELEEGANHTNIVQIHTGLRTQVPRHNRIKRELARLIVRYIIVDMKVPEDDVRAALKTALPILPQNKRQQ